MRRAISTARPHNGGTSGYGTVFQLDSSGTLTVLHSFTGGSDGAYPEAGLTADTAGNLYGTTYGGGASGQGTVFQVTLSGVLTVLYSFTGGSDGGSPVADLLADAAGNLYGTTAFGGAGTSCPKGLRHGVPADGTGEFYRGPGESHYDHETARARASDGPPLTIFGCPKKSLSSTIRIRGNPRGTSS
jgi:uncharacterized repeat protein (TIGR03803 family)